MIRVLQVLHGMDCGGAETMIMNLYRHIDRSKIQFDFLVHTTKKCFFDDEIKKLGGNIYYVPYYKVINGKQYKIALNQFFVSHPEIKIVHGHLGSCAHIYLQIAKQYGCFAIAHSHSTKPKVFSLKNPLYRFFTYRTRQIADYFLGCSKDAVEYRFGNKIAHSDRCFILKNAIDSKKFIYSDQNRTEIRSEFAIRKEDFVIGHIGRMDKGKNQTFLVDVFHSIYKKNRNSHLILVGSGFLRKELEQKVEQLGLKENVIFAGVRADAAKILSAMDVFVFPSLFEGLGIVAIEAQTAGLHVVCSDTIPKEVGVTSLIEFRSLNEPAKTWANAIIKYSEPYVRLNMQQKIIKAGYDIQTTAKWLENFYVSI